MGKFTEQKVEFHGKTLWQYTHEDVPFFHGLYEERIEGPEIDGGAAYAAVLGDEVYQHGTSMGKITPDCYTGNVTTRRLISIDLNADEDEE